MYETGDFRKGLKIEFEGTPWVIVDFQHVSPGKGAAFTRTKMKNLLTGNSIERNIRSGEKVGVPNIEEKQYQYMYSDSEGYHMMEQKTFEQIALSDEHVGDRKNYFQEGSIISVLFYNDRAIAVDVPTFVVLAIVETQPGLRGDTVSGGSKPAKLETGAVVNIPLHLNEGDKIKVDTRDNSYVEKVN